MRLTWKISLFGLAAIALVSLAATGPLMSKVEQPSYNVELAEGSIEIRSYAPSVVAEVSMSGDRKAAIQQGFSIIARYIFGGNAASQKIEMTAPVMQERSSDIQASSQIGDTWAVQFIMPAKWSLDALPKPGDRRITLKSLPNRTMAAIRFSGLARDDSIHEKTDELLSFIAKHHLVQIAPPIYAFFNPPWTLPPFRRNEVMIPIKAMR